MRTLRPILIAALLVGSVGAEPACSKITDPPQTMRIQFDEAKVILVGRLENPRQIKNDLLGGETDLIVMEVLRRDPVLKGQKKFVLPHYIPTAKVKPNTYVVLADIYKGKLDFYWGRAMGAAGPAYVRGILKLDPKKPAEMVRFYADHLQHADDTIADDAYSEIGHAAATDPTAVGRALDAAKLWTWLRDPEIAVHRKSVYAGLLGACGKPEDADALLEWMRDVKYEKMNKAPAIASVLMLNPKKHLPHYVAIAQDRKQTFIERYMIFQAMRSLHDRAGAGVAGALPRRTCEDVIEKFLDHDDMADLAIEDFRRWKRWDKTEHILGMYEKKEFRSQLIKKGIVRFALQAPGPQAAAFVAKLRKADPESVQDVEEYLKLEVDVQAGPK